MSRAVLYQDVPSGADRIGILDRTESYDASELADNLGSLGNRQRF